MLQRADADVRRELAFGSLVALNTGNEEMIRLLLLLAVIALATDAITNDGGYTKAAWGELSAYSLKLVGPNDRDVDTPANPPS
jgi:hypothetical protein